MKPKTEAELQCYFEGMRAAIRSYAWWKNGKQYVGCGVYELADALIDVEILEMKSRAYFLKTGEPWPACFAPASKEG